MSDENRWDQDPLRDERLARMLRAGEPDRAVDWEELCREVMRGTTRSTGLNWWDFVAQWGRVAVAASLVAMVVSGLLLWQVVTGPPEPEMATAAPESIAVARAASAYPDETAFASLVRTEHQDEFTTWGTR
jgi:hypothetical protein